MSELPERTLASEKKSFLCACGSPRRPGGYDCRKCHRERMRLTRKRKRERWELLQSVVESLTVYNRETREKFEAQCRSRWVVVLADPGDEVEDFAGRVTSFHPGDMVSVIDINGRTHAVPLRKVREDLGRKLYVSNQAGERGAKGGLFRA